MVFFSSFRVKKWLKIDFFDLQNWTVNFHPPLIATIFTIDDMLSIIVNDMSYVYFIKTWGWTKSKITGLTFFVLGQTCWPNHPYPDVWPLFIWPFIICFIFKKQITIVHIFLPKQMATHMLPFRPILNDNTFIVLLPWQHP